MKEIEYLMPPEQDRLSRLAADYDEADELFREAEEETEKIYEALENAYAIDQKSERAIRDLLDRQDAINSELERKANALRQELEWEEAV